MGFSKGYAFAGLLIGAVICPKEEDTDAISNLSLAEDTAYGVSVISQVGAQAALERRNKWLSSF
jgi:aspartate/methionine/tyrosine aminotransferase